MDGSGRRACGGFAGVRAPAVFSLVNHGENGEGLESTVTRGVSSGLRVSRTMTVTVFPCLRVVFGGSRLT